MVIEIQGILVNILIILLGQLSILIVNNTKLATYNSKFRKKIIFFLASGIAIILCMTFTFPINDDYQYDLRYIPLLLGTLYGGVEVGIGLYVLLNIYRLTIGGFGIVITFINSTILTIIACLFSKKYIHLKTVYKILIPLLLVNSTPFSGAIVHHYLNEPQLPLEQWVVNAVFLSTGTVLLVYFTEVINKHLYIKDQMIRLEKSITVSHLAASIAHEIRNPLTTVKGFLQLLFIKEFDEKRRSYYKTIFSELDRAESIIHEYLTLAKPQSDEIISFNTKTELDKIESILTPFAKKYNVEIHTSTTALMIRGNVNQFVQAMINIVKNGIEAMPNGGTLSISSEEKNGEIVITITDEGIGLTKEQLSSLGQPYFSTKGEQGTGLGLLVTYNIIHSMGGSVKVDSEVGNGTTFKVTFPLDEKNQETHTEIASEKQ